VKQDRKPTESPFIPVEIKLPEGFTLFPGVKTVLVPTISEDGRVTLAARFINKEGIILHQEKFTNDFAWLVAQGIKKHPTMMVLVADIIQPQISPLRPVDDAIAKILSEQGGLSLLYEKKHYDLILFYKKRQIATSWASLENRKGLWDRRHKPR